MDNEAIKNQWVVEAIDPRWTASYIIDQLQDLALTHPDFTTQDMVLMAPTIARLKELRGYDENI